MIALAWHVFIVVWGTGCLFVVIHRYNNTETKRLQREVENQVLQTRKAELGARERRALER